MQENQKEVDFEIDREAVERYFRTTQSILCLFLTVFFGLGIVLALLHYYKHNKFSRWFCPQQVNNLRYWLDGNILRVDGGVFFLFRKSISLERITDVTLVQGPVLRFCGIWALQIQTAGSQQCEATLYGVYEPEKIRDLILSSRQSVYGEKSGDA
jgi:membrane protein YdbS with pleckstrin-like domain